MNQAKKDEGASIYKRLCAALREEDPALDSICAAQALAVTLAKSFGLSKELFVQATADSWDLGEAPSNVDVHLMAHTGRVPKSSIDPKKVRKLTAELLRLAADSFSNHGCNDLERPPYFTKEEWTRMASEFESWNSDGEDPASPLGDWTAMLWCAELIEKGGV